MKFRTQILSLGLAGVLLVMLTGGIGFFSTSRLGQAITGYTDANEALAASAEADMMHDALRGDAQQAMIAALTSAPALAGVSQVGEAVTQMDQVTQQNAALVEQSAAAAESLKAQAQQLVQTVAMFRLGHAGATSVALQALARPHAMARAHSFPTTERRNTPRSQKLVHLPARKPAAAPAAPPVLTNQGPTRKVANGADNDWTTF